MMDLLYQYGENPREWLRVGKQGWLRKSAAASKVEELCHPQEHLGG